jgi:hypothetical protein
VSAVRVVFALCLSLMGCNSARPSDLVLCATDADCDNGKLCFAEGCGDPGKGIVVEVTGSQLSREFPISTGGLGAVQDFDLGVTPSINGQFQASVSALNPLEKTFYSDAVLVRAVGESPLLPGISRTFESRFDRTERGFFEMKVGAGSFTLTAIPGERALPPATASVVVSQDSASTVNFAFPAISGATALSGQLIKVLDTRVRPPEPVLVSAAYELNHLTSPTIDLQLFDPRTNTPLTQRVPVATTTGEFALILSPEAKLLSKLLIVASPREPGVAVPTKRFTLEAPFASTVSLEYGDFGDPADVTGTVNDSTGAPIAGAQVVVEGTVTGDGNFRSKIVETNALGQFTVQSLGSKNDNSFQLTVVPPRTSRAAFSQRNVSVSVVNGVATMSPASFTLEDRLMTRGLVLRPDGVAAAAGCVVRAAQQVDTTATNGAVRALPVEPAETVTAEDGSFELPLDPGLWRFEYTPGQMLPIASRLVTIKALVDNSTGLKLPNIELAKVQLANGRSVQGNITGTMSKAGDVVPFSQLRFFRVAPVEGKPTSILLGSTIADERGHYLVVLPTVTTVVDAGSP